MKEKGIAQAESANVTANRRSTGLASLLEDFLLKLPCRESGARKSLGTKPGHTCKAHNHNSDLMLGTLCQIALRRKRAGRGPLAQNRVTPLSPGGQPQAGKGTREVRTAPHNRSKLHRREENLQRALTARQQGITVGWISPGHPHLKPVYFRLSCECG